jgi:hypothetical protein
MGLGKFNELANSLKNLVGVRGFEPPTPASRTQYSTRLSYTPRQMVCRFLRQHAVLKAAKNYRETSNRAVRNYGQPRKPLIVAKLIWNLNPVSKKLLHWPSEFRVAPLRGCTAGRAYP